MTNWPVPLGKIENPVTLKEWLFDNKLVFCIAIFAITCFANLTWTSYQIPNEINDLSQFLSNSNTPFAFQLKINRTYSLMFDGNPVSPYQCGYITIKNGKVVSATINGSPTNLVFNQNFNLTQFEKVLNKCSSLLINYGSSATATRGSFSISYTNSKITNISKPQFVNRFCLSVSGNC